MVTMVKVPCSMCDGKKYIEEKEYRTTRKVKIKCPACNGRGYNKWELYEDL